MCITPLDLSQSVSAFSVSMINANNSLFSDIFNSSFISLLRIPMLLHLAAILWKICENSPNTDKIEKTQSNQNELKHLEIISILSANEDHSMHLTIYSSNQMLRILWLTTIEWNGKKKMSWWKKNSPKSNSCWRPHSATLRLTSGAFLASLNELNNWNCIKILPNRIESFFHKKMFNLRWLSMDSHHIGQLSLVVDSFAKQSEFHAKWDIAHLHNR